MADIFESDVALYSLLELDSHGVTIHLVAQGEAPDRQFGLYVQTEPLERGAVIAAFHEDTPLEAALSLLVAITHSSPKGASPEVQRVLQLMSADEGE